MNQLYALHSWSKHYREEALREAGRRHLVERAEIHASRDPRGVRRTGLASWRNPLSLLRGVASSENSPSPGRKVRSEK